MLNLKQNVFVNEYLKSGNATEAYKLAYGVSSDKTARANASRMLTNANILAEIEKFKQAMAENTKVTLDRVVEELAKLAFSDLSQIVEWDGKELKIKPFTELTGAQLASISEISETDTKFGSRRSIKMHSKLSALDSLMKHLGGYVTMKDIIERLTPEQIEELSTKILNSLKEDKDEKAKQ